MRQTTVRLSPATDRQIEALTQAGWGTQSDIIKVAIDRMYREEIKVSDKQQTIVLNESGYNTGMTFEAYCVEAAKYGDNPADYGTNIDDFVFVSKDYALQDEMWNPDWKWPEDLPVWQYRPN